MIFFLVHTRTSVPFRQFTKEKMFWRASSPVHFLSKNVLSFHWTSEAHSTSMCSWVNNNSLYMKTQLTKHDLQKHENILLQIQTMGTLKSRLPLQSVKAISLTTWPRCHSPAEWVFKLIWSLVDPYVPRAQNSVIPRRWVEIIHRWHLQKFHFYLTEKHGGWRADLIVLMLQLCEKDEHHGKYTAQNAVPHQPDHG